MTLFYKEKFPLISEIFHLLKLNCIIFHQLNIISLQQSSDAFIYRHYIHSQIILYNIFQNNENVHITAKLVYQRTSFTYIQNEFTRSIEYE